MSTKVYYNSACPVCDAGIKDQRRRMEACGVKDVEWIDVHTHPDAVSELDAPLEEVRERLHVKTSTGQIDVGADAFLDLWAQTPKQQRLANLLRLPILKQFTRIAYNIFARLLYRWNRAMRHW
jgi:predicted DCC family thiol-disulfide oxidoreductase YuxK